jgi:hypothetical protein
MNRSLVALIVGVSCGSIVAIGACGGSSSDDSAVVTNDATVGDTGTTDDSGNPIGDSGGPIDSGTPVDSGTPMPDAGSCGDLTDGGCFKCCAVSDPDAAAVLAADAIDCACNNPGDCKIECATTVCKKPKAAAPDGKCEKCLVEADAGSCIEKAKTAACGTSTSCDDVVACLQTCTN